MEGSRKKQFFRITAILCVVGVLFAFMLYSWQSYSGKAVAAEVQYRDLLTKFNKQTAELTRKEG